MSESVSLLQRFGILEAFKDVRVLSIDDSEVFLKAINTILNHVGCVVTSCSDPTKAIELAREFKPDIIIIDYEMPKIDGPQLSRIFKSDKDFNQIPIILLTSRVDAESMLTALDAGADDFITKNNLAEVLLAKTGCMLRLSKLNKELVAFRQFEAVKNLIATYNHEFNNTLTILNGYIRMLEKNTTEENQDRIDKLKSTSKRMQEIIEKLSNIKEYKTASYGHDGSMLKI